jgi:hypothetical protein
MVLHIIKLLLDALRSKHNVIDWTKSWNWQMTEVLQMIEVLPHGQS